MSIINSQPRIGAAGQSTGFKIERSLRFNSADSAYLNRTPASAGNRKTWTFSCWLKRSGIGSGTQELLQVETVNGSTYTAVNIVSDALYIDSYGATGALQARAYTSAVFRDVGAWYHIVAVLNTTSATASDRAIIYVNGVRQTVTISDGFDQDAELLINTTNEHRIGADVLGNEGYLSGYMTEINFVDGSTPTTTTRTVGGVTETVLTQFGEFDTDTGVWKPKAYSGSYGTNGFYLKFADNSGTTSTTLGKDSSGNGNNWTPNNFYVGPGTTNAEKAGIDSLVDTPTPYGTDTGVGGEVRGNYATWNPIYVIPNNTANTFVNGNLQFAPTQAEGTGESSAVATMPLPTTGKWYWEVTPTAVATSATRTQIGIMAQSTISYAMGLIGSGNFAYTANGGAFSKVNNNIGGSYGDSYAANDVIGVAVDLDNGAIYFAKNGTWQNSGVPTSGSSKTGAAYTTLTGSSNYFPAVGYWGTFVANFGQRPFAYTAPSGFKALCTQNLPTPTIGATSTTQAGKYFNTVLWAGNSTANRSITGVGFQPDFVWIKDRTVANWHNLFDAVRGAGIRLVTNSTAAEVSNQSYGYLSAFNSDGFTVTNGSGGYDNVNISGSNYVGWSWKANGAGSSNTAGSITSTVSANTTAGFSVVTWTNPSSGTPTIGHGLGVAPTFIIVKDRTFAYNWDVGCTSIGWANRLNLNDTAAAYSPAFWNSTAPTSTVFTYAASGANSGDSMVAYCFAPVAGYSAFGSYTGNGSSDGPFVFTGFRPRYILFKNASAVSGWNIFDTARDTYNAADKYLGAQTSAAESSGTAVVDILSNGFKVRNTWTDVNGSGNTIVYAAFAEVPQKFSLGR